MSGKTLSNGTMSLKFMQNAQRAKFQAQVEAEQAKIKDDAEWSVSKEVRDAWGIASSSDQRDDVIHESSYLPFIFQQDVEGSSSQSDTKPKPRGRRSFNARGQEVLVNDTPLKQDESSHGKDEGAEEHENGGKPDSQNPRKLPKSISGFKIPLSTRSEGKKHRTKTAHMLIHEDISAQPPTSLMNPDAVSIPRGAGFVKPAGIDDPVLPPRKAVADVRKRDREYDLASDRLSLEGAKRKKRRDAGSMP